MNFNNVFSIFIRQIQMVLATLNTTELVVNVIEIVLLGVLIFFLYRKYIKGTSSENMVRGVVVLIGMWLISEIFMVLGLKVFGMFLRAFAAIVIFGLIVIFQPELRRFLGYLGQGNLLSRIFLNKNEKNNKDEGAKVIKELIETIKYLSKFKIGALIVLKGCDDCNIGYEVGTDVNADISQELLLTIFHPNTPLHDGAVVITNNRIRSAGVLLPLTEDPKLSWRYGTRHRAAIGASETFDCACIVVSEETGNVSIAIDGVLKKFEDLGQLKSSIEQILMLNPKDSHDKRISIFNFNKSEKKEVKNEN